MKRFLENYYLLLIIIIFASILRLYQLSSIPISLNPDETAIGYNSYSILKTGLDEYGKLPIALKSFGDWKLPIYPLFSSLPIMIFSLNEFSVRIVSALAGIFQIVLIYFIAFKIFNKKYLALFAALFLTFSPWAIYFSRIAYEVNLATMFFLAGFLTFLKYVENKDKNGKYLLAASIFYSISIFTYHAYIIFIPIFVLICSLIFIKSFKKNVWTLTSLILITIAIFLSLYISTSSNKSKLSDVTIFSDKTVIFNRAEIFRTDNSSSDPFVTKILHNKITGLTYHVAQNYLTTYSPSFLFDKGGEKFLHNIGTFGNLYLFDILLLILGFVAIVKIEKNKRILLLLIWIILAPIPSAITKDAPSSTRLFILLPALVLVMASGADYFVDKIKNYKLYGKTILALFILLYFINVVYFLDAYFIHMNFQRARYLHYGFKEMVQISEKYKDYNVVVFGPENFPYISFLFYTKYDPVKFRKEVEYYPENYANFVYVKKFGKYEFVDNLDYSNLKDKTIYFDYRGIRDEDMRISYPSGEPAIKYFFKNENE